MVAACSEGRLDQASVKQMLQANDAMVCASSDVQRAALNAIDGRYEKFIVEGGEPLVFQSVTSTGIDKDIHEVSCSALVRFPQMLVGTESISEVEVPLVYKVRPSLGGDGEFVVDAASPTNFFNVHLGRFVLLNTKANREEAQPLSQNVGRVEGFNRAEAELIASANSAWSGYRNGDPAAEVKFNQLLDQLYEGGICWGENNQSQAEYVFHRCGSNSIQKQPAPSAGSDAAMCNAGDHDACMRL